MPDSACRGTAPKRRASCRSTASWNFAISRVLPGNFVLDATYTGSKGTHLASDRVNIMQIDPKYAYLGSLLNKPIDDPAVVALGFSRRSPNFKTAAGRQRHAGPGAACRSRNTRVSPPAE